MSNRQSLKQKMILNIILTASNFLFPLITYSHAARVILPSGTGKVAFVQSALAYFSFIASLGISAYGIRECAKVRDDKEKLSVLVQEILIINFASTLVAYIVLIASIILVPKFRDNSSLFLIMSCGIILETLGIEWLYRSLEQYTYITIRSIAFKCVSALLIITLVKKESDYLIYGALTIFATSASYILNFIYSRKYISYKRFKSIKYNPLRHIKPIFILFFATIVISVYTHFDTMMIGFMKTDVDVGLYNATVKMKTIVTSLSTAITAVLIPRLSIYYNEKQYDRFNEYICKSFRITLIIMFPISAWVMLNSRDVLLFVCGSEYVDAYRTLCVIMLCTIVLSITNLFGNQILIPSGNEKRLSKSVFIGLFINVALNALLIPSFNYFGAAVATLITELFNAFYMGLGCKEQFLYLKNNIKLYKYLIPLVFAMLIELLIVKATVNLSLFLRILINALVFFSIYYLIEIILREPIVREGIIWVKRNLQNIKSHE